MAMLYQLSYASARVQGVEPWPTVLETAMLP